MTSPGSWKQTAVAVVVVVKNVVCYRPARQGTLQVVPWAETQISVTR